MSMLVIKNDSDEDKDSNNNKNDNSNNDDEDEDDDEEEDDNGDDDDEDYDDDNDVAVFYKQFMGDTDNPYTFAQGENSVGKGVLSLGYSCNGQPVPVESAEEPILLWMERKFGDKWHNKLSNNFLMI